MRILLPIPRYDYGKPEWGDSFEYIAFQGSLQAMGHETRLFDTLDTRWRGDPTLAGRKLLTVAADFEPDLVLMMMMEDEIPLEAVRELGRSATTANWFADDVWRFRTFSRHVAPAFTWAITTSRRALEQYRNVKDVRPLYAPWGFNPTIFQPSTAPILHDVSFIGQRHGVRARMIDRLRGDGLNVFVRGAHWPGGRLTYSELAATFAVSKINLNFLASSAGPLRRVGLRFRGSYRLDGLLLKVVPPPLQMKARLVEIPAAGGFQITDDLPELRDMFALGEEVVVASSYSQLRDTIQYFLDHEDERAAVAQRGLARAHSDHTFPNRFSDVFGRMGLA